MHGFPDWFIFCMGYLKEISIGIAALTVAGLVALIYWVKS